MKYILIILALLMVGCKGDEAPEDMKLIGTMSVYRTENGALTVMNDQTKDAMMIEWNINRVLVRKEAPSK